jgi:hypothetical protein
MKVYKLSDGQRLTANEAAEFLSIHVRMYGVLDSIHDQFSTELQSKFTRITPKEARESQEDYDRRSLAFLRDLFRKHSLIANA